MAEEETQNIVATEEAPPAEDDKPKVLKKVGKPDEAEFQAKVEAVNVEIKALQDEVASIRQKLDEASSQRTGQQDVLQEARAEMNRLKGERDQVKGELQQIINARNEVRSKLDESIAAGRNMRSELKFTSVGEIDAEIRRLERKQNTTSMNLREEKQLIKEIETLQKSKKMVAKFGEQEATIGSAREATKDFQGRIAEKQAEVKAVQEKLAAQRAVLDSLGSRNEEEKSQVPDLIKKRNDLRKTIDEKYQSIRNMRAENKKALDEHYNYLREVRRQRSEARRKEQEARRAQEEERRKQLEAEELLKVPYEEEMTLCDTLVAYLEKLGSPDAPPPPPAQDQGPAPCATHSSMDFDGMVLKAHKRDDDDEQLWGAGGGKKKGKKGGKKKGEKKGKKDQIVHAIDTLESFALLSLDPPANTAAVSGAIEAVKAKKEWYSQQPRGSVPRLGQSEDDKEKSPEKKKGGKKPVGFTASGDEEAFPTLPGFKPPAPKPAPTEAEEGGEKEGEAEGEEGADKAAEAEGEDAAEAEKPSEAEEDSPEADASS